MHEQTILMPPSLEIVTLTYALEAVIPRYTQAQDTAKQSIGTYEAPFEALAMMGLIIRHTESMLLLARTDLVLLPSGFALMRAAFETAIRTQWLLLPAEPFAREARWLTFLREEERHLRLLTQDAPPTALSRYQQVHDFRDGVEARLPPAYRPIPPLPTFEMMLREVHSKETYRLYRILSQYTHGTRAATELYHRHLGTAMELGEFIDPSEWFACLNLGWFCVRTTGEAVLRSFDADIEVFLHPDVTQPLIEAFQKLEAAVHASEA